jgi:tetratricopeptide (TPR) repeat protein
MLLLALLLLLQSDPAALGMKALDEQKYEQAVTHFAAALKADPEDLSANFHYGLALSMVNRDAEAIPAYQKVLAKQPDLFEAQLNLAVLLLRTKRPADALPLLEKAQAQQPKQFRPNYYLGEAHLDLQHWESAETALQAALAIDAANAPAMASLGKALAKQGRVKESANWYQSAVKTDPSFKEALLELAGFHEAAGQKAEAAALYRLFPDNGAARERLGVLLLEQGEAADAVAQLEKAVAESPTTANRLALATAYLKAKQNAKAAPLLLQAAAAEPGDPELRLTLGRLYREDKRLPDAAREFLAAAQINANLKPAWSELGATLFLLGDYPQALKAFSRFKALGEEQNPSVLYLEALCYDRQQLYKEALPAYEKFLAAAGGKMPEEEFKGRQRLRIVKRMVEKR